MTERLGTNGWWWDTNKTAKWGDISAYRDERGEYIYLLGNPPQGQQGNAGQYVYQARVKAKDAFDLSKYEYWWGRQQGWKSKLLDTFTPETAVMWGVGQGSMVYSNFYNCYFYVHTFCMYSCTTLDATHRTDLLFPPYSHWFYSHQNCSQSGRAMECGQGGV